MDYTILLIGVLIGNIVVRRNFFLLVMFYYYHKFNSEEKLLGMYDQFTVKSLFEELRRVESLPNDHAEFVQFMQLKRDKAWDIFTSYLGSIKSALSLEYGVTFLISLIIVFIVGDAGSYLIGFLVAHTAYWLKELLQGRADIGYYVLTILEVILREASKKRS